MSRDRLDLSDWLIHFVHRRNPEFEVYDDDEPSALPMHADPAVVEKFESWADRDLYAANQLEPDAYAISVLGRILATGHLRAGWSIRGGKPTIYGPRPAVCFTEMPLGALMEYARTRGDESRVASFGIAVRRGEAYAAGARPVIYGLSRTHKEVPSRTIWPRYLDSSCGIAVHEQYRYVATSLGSGRTIDWMHEREWRWCDVDDRLDVPGLPLWLKDSPVFSTILIIVEQRADVERLLDQLQIMSDAETDEYEISHYSREAIRRTRILALEELPSLVSSKVRIDDLPLKQLATPTAVAPDEKLIARVQETLHAAREAAKKAIAEKSYGGSFGFANVVNGSPRSAVAQALLAADQASPHPNGFVLWNVTDALDNSGSLPRMRREPRRTS